MGLREGRWGGRSVATALCGGLGALLLSAPAAAQGAAGFDTFGGGVFLGYAFGGERGLEWGVEAFATRYFEDPPSCGHNDVRRAGFGPLLRFSMLKLSRPAFTGAVHAGGEAIRRSLAFDGELGATLAYQHDQAFGSLHTALLVESWFFHAYAQQEWLLPSYSVGGGLRVQPTFGDVGSCEVGRPFRDAAGRRQACAVRRGSAFDTRCPDAQRWAQRSSEELASVLSFLQLASELERLGAPAALTTRARQAAHEELGHARAAARLAEAFGGAPATPLPARPVLRPSLSRAQSLRRLALESWYDGCLNEGLAASIAHAEQREAGAPEEARTLAIIAREESGHAELALEVLCWALQQSPELVRQLALPRPRPSELQVATRLAAGALGELVHTQRTQAERVLRSLAA